MLCDFMSFFDGVIEKEPENNICFTKRKRNRKEMKKRKSFTILSKPLVVSNLLSETEGSQFVSGCYLCAEVNSMQ